MADDDQKKTIVKEPISAGELLPELPATGETTALVPVNVKTDELVPISSFTREQQAQIAERVRGKTLQTMSDQEIVLWGSGRQRELGQKLDALLGHVTKKDAPVVFEVFRRVKKGVKDVNLDEVEEEIRRSLNEPWYIRLMIKLRITDPEKRIEEMQEYFRRLITGKVQTLQDLTGKMEQELLEGIRALIGEGVTLAHQVNEFRTNVIAYGMEVAAGRIILEEAKAEEARMLEEAKTSKDPIKTQDLREFQQRMRQFESRLLVLKTAYVDAPVTLEMLGGIKGAALETLGETANASLEDFNKIKSLLLMLTALYKVKAVQEMNARRRLVKQQLQQLTVKLYESTTTAAAQAAGDNRLEDAQLVLTVATELERIGDKVAGIHAENTQKFAEAEKLLIQARDKMTQIGTKGITHIAGGDPLAKF